MNIKQILRSISRLLLVEALMIFISLIVSFIYREPTHVKMAIINSICIILVVSLPFSFVKRTPHSIGSKEGLVIITLSWILISFFGAFPLYLSGQYETMVDAFFEVSSGFTTTGASVLSDVSGLSNSIKFWKALMQAIGGMGVLVFALAIIPNDDRSNIHLMKAEVPGPTFGKVVSKLRDSAIILYKIYFFLITVMIIALVIAGMPLFDAILNTFETAGTGGFAVHNGSIGYYDSVAIELIIGIGMLLFSVNFALYHLFLINKAKNFFKSEELRWFIGIVALCIALVTINVTPILGFKEALRHSFFTISSNISTTGFTSIDHGKWPLFSQFIILLTMFIGGCAGSTAGGLKVSRVATAIKASFNEIKKSRNPKRILRLRFEGKIIDDIYLKSILNYFTLYALMFTFLVICLTLDFEDFMSAFSAVAATFNNIGGGLGEVGPAYSFGAVSDINKVLLSFGMIAGRLEIIPMIVLFTPGTWKRV